MVSSNIATVFAPNFLQFAKPTGSLKHPKSVSEWVAWAIGHQDEAFDEPVEFPGDPAAEHGDARV